MAEYPYDAIYYNARVVTLDPEVREASLVAVRGDRIALVAVTELQEELKRNTARIVDCGGRTLLPGFVDAHCHVAAYAESLVSINLSAKDGVRSIQDIRDKIRDACARAAQGEWIRGKHYNEFHIEENRHPTRRDLDAAAPSNPVKLTHRSGHAHVLNGLALKIVGINAATGDPPGGMIDRDPETGRPTGLLFGMGGYLSDRVPGLDEIEIERGLERVNEKLLSCGITSIQDASSSNDSGQWKRFESWKQRGLLTPRLTMMLGLSAFNDFDKKDYVSALPETDLKLGAVKIMVDRVTGSLHPPQKELNDIIASVHSAGCQAAIHAVEEPVVEAAAKGIADARRLHFRPDARHRIEHCSVCRPELLQSLARLGVKVVTQPAFLHYEGDRYMKTVPADDLENLYPVGAMLESDVGIGFGSDFPIADPDPWAGIGAAVTRSSEDGRRMPGQAIHLYSALRMQTMGGAAANFEEHVKGSISPGKMADFVLLSEDPFSVSPDRIKDIRTAMTVLGGEIVWSER